MSKYFLIESRDPFETGEVANDYILAADLAKAGNETTLFLVQNGVLPVRQGAKKDGLKSAMDSGVNVICDEFSLRERGITNVTEGVEISPLEIVVDHLADGDKTMWL